MSADDSSNRSATPGYLDIAITARSLIVQRNEWQKNWIRTAPAPDKGLNSQDQQVFAGWQKEQDQLKPITEERTDKDIQRLPEQHRQTAKEDVQKILSGGHDMELNRTENGVPVWSQWANSPLGQELGNEARIRARAPSSPAPDATNVAASPSQPAQSQAENAPNIVVPQEPPNDDARRAELLAKLDAMPSYLDRIPGVEPEISEKAEIEKEFAENKQDITAPPASPSAPSEPDGPDHEL